MRWRFPLACGLAVFSAVPAAAQELPPAAPVPAAPVPAPAAPAPGEADGYSRARDLGYSPEPESRLAELAQDYSRPPAPPPRFGPTPVDQVGILQNLIGSNRVFESHGIRTYGWFEGGYTGASGSPGLLTTQTRLNRYGDEFLANELGFVVIKPLDQEKLDWGFHVRYYAGANAVPGQPLGGIDDPPGNSRFSHDFRDLYLSAHLPILTEGGVNVKVGRMNTIIGWNGYLAPWRPTYSNDYQFFYSQDGAFTGFLTQLVVSDQLNIWNGMTFGANTFFTKRSEDSICYIGQVNYWLTAEKQTLLTASTYVGPNAIFAAPGMAGDFVSMVEARIVHTWSERFTQVVQSNFGWDDNTPVGTGSWYGVYSQGVVHLTEDWDFFGRGEWFRDVRGTRTGFNTDYSEVTLGLNWHPNAWLEFRPEVRGDFAGVPAFGTKTLSREQVTAAASFLVKF
jgi:hypothetical protein